MRDFEATSNILRALSAMGIRIAVDDFGTGYSNFSYLKRFPINTLKPDRSFIGEGVETLQQLQLLKAFDCEEAHGYYFSKPLDLRDCQIIARTHKTPLV